MSRSTSPSEAITWLHSAGQPVSALELGDGERLTAQEVREGWRLRAELVTLSVCQTGVSRVLRGDEPMGLVRAFLRGDAGRGKSGGRAAGGSGVVAGAVGGGTPVTRGNLAR